MVRHEAPWCLVVLLYCYLDYAAVETNTLPSQHAPIDLHVCGADARHN